jgi:hypothetical protein
MQYDTIQTIIESPIPDREKKKRKEKKEKNQQMPSDFSGGKNPQHAFLRRGSKAACPMSQIRGM